jgi:cytochrome c-type biogenesis protein CcmH
MTVFYSIGALMALAAMLFVAFPLLRSQKPSSAPAQDAANVAIYADQSAEMQSDLRNGLLSQQQYDLAQHELERRLLQDIPPAATPTPIGKSARWPGVIIALLLPVIAVSLYFKLGNPAAINPPVDPMLAQMQQVEAMLPKLEQKLREQPQDVTGWTMLGKASMMLERYPKAVEAYAKLVQLTPQDAQAYADYADALAMANGQKLSGQPAAFIAQALKLDPNNGKAHYLAGFAAIEQGDTKTAIAHWEKLLAQLPPETEGAMMLREKLAELKQQSGTRGVLSSSADISGQVNLAATLKNNARPNDTLFIFARAVSGPKMPLAMLKVQVKDLPVHFKLDDSMAMSPQMKLSNFPEVVIVARVSKSGTAVTQAGDLEGVSAPVKLGAKNVAVQITHKVE